MPRGNRRRNARSCRVSIRIWSEIVVSPLAFTPYAARSGDPAVPRRARHRSHEAEHLLAHAVDERPRVGRTHHADLLRPVRSKESASPGRMAGGNDEDVVEEGDRDEVPAMRALVRADRGALRLRRLGGPPAAAGCTAGHGPFERRVWVRRDSPGPLRPDPERPVSVDAHDVKEAPMDTVHVAVKAVDLDALGAQAAAAIRSRRQAGDAPVRVRGADPDAAVRIRDHLGLRSLQQMRAREDVGRRRARPRARAAAACRRDCDGCQKRHPCDLHPVVIRRGSAVCHPPVWTYSARCDSLSTACAAASRASGTRYGEQLT